MRCILGVDFDNTLVNYDDVLWKTAQRMGFIADTVRRHKKSIRDAIRPLPEGEKKWQQVQAHVYGKAMAEAMLIDGVAEFLRTCRRANVPVYIVSHKTKFAAQDTDKIDLREAALEWMTQKGFFEAKGLGFSRDQIFFESTRREKVGRIKKLGCTHFIDDLEETFEEKMFPKDIQKILYAPQTNGSLPKDITVMSNWREIHEYFFSQGR
jgi:hypothetical protein